MTTPQPSPARIGQRGDALDLINPSPRINYPGLPNAVITTQLPSPRIGGINNTID